MKRKKTVFLPTCLLLFGSLWLVAFSPARGQDHPMRILGVAEAAPDLDVRLLGNALGPEMIRVRVLDFFGEVAGEVVLPAPGPGEAPLVVIPGVLEGVVSQGTQYRVEVLDLDGETVASPYPFRLALTCSEDGTCSYRLMGGLDAGPSLVIGPELAQALEDLAGADDLLGEVLAIHPHLLGEVATLGWELDLLEQAYPGNEDCVCRYTTQIVHDNASCGGYCGASHYFSIHMKPEIDPNGGHCTERLYIGNGEPVGQGNGGGGGGPDPIPYYSITGSTELRTGASCWDVSSGAEVELEVITHGGKEILNLPLPALGNCEIECGVDLSYSAWQQASMRVESDWGPGQATEAVSFEVGGTLIYQLGVQAQTPPTGGVDSDTQNFSGSAPAAFGAVARVESTGTVDLSATHGTAYGMASSWFILWAHGQSTCTGPRTITVSAQASPENPGSGADVNILVGQCDG